MCAERVPEHHQYEIFKGGMRSFSTVALKGDNGHALGARAVILHCCIYIKGCDILWINKHQHVGIRSNSQ